MPNVTIYLSTGKSFKTDVEKYDAQEVVKMIKESTINEVAIGTVVFNKQFFQAVAISETQETEDPVL